MTNFSQPATHFRPDPEFRMYDDASALNASNAVTQHSPQSIRPHLSRNISATNPSTITPYYSPYVALGSGNSSGTWHEPSPPNISNAVLQDSLRTVRPDTWDEPSPPNISNAVLQDCSPVVGPDSATLSEDPITTANDDISLGNFDVEWSVDAAVSKDFAASTISAPNTEGLISEDTANLNNVEWSADAAVSKDFAASTIPASNTEGLVSEDAANLNNIAFSDSGNPTLPRNKQTELGKSVDIHMEERRVRREKLVELFDDEDWRLNVLQPWALEYLQFWIPDLHGWAETFDSTIIPNRCLLTAERNMRARSYGSPRRQGIYQFRIPTIDGPLSVRTTVVAWLLLACRKATKEQWLYTVQRKVLSRSSQTRLFINDS